MLPPGAELVFVSDPNSVTTTCDTPIPETTAKCYLFRFPLAGTTYNNPSPSDDSFRAAKLYLDDVVISVDPPIGDAWCEGVLTETRNQFVNRLANQLWGQFGVLGSPVLGLYVMSFQISDDDVNQMVISLPDIFSNVELELYTQDQDAGIVAVRVKGQIVDCDSDWSSEEQYTASTVKGIIG